MRRELRVMRNTINVKIKSFFMIDYNDEML